MKKLFAILVTALALVILTTSAVLAAPPVVETWEFGAARNGLIRATYDINTTNLKTVAFHFYNDTTDIYAIPYVLIDGEEVWRQVVPPQSTYDMDYVVNFKRLPATDPDDPNSIRYPAGYSFGMWTGDDPDAYP